jgi:hypothetical protein
MHVPDVVENLLAWTHTRGRTVRERELACTLALALSALGLGACDGATVTVTGSGPIVREMRSFGAAGKTSASGSDTPSEVHLTSELDLSVHVGREFAVWIDGHTELVGLVSASLEGPRLTLSVPRNTRLVPPPHVEVELPTLAALTVEGAGTARVTDVAGEALSLTLAGSGDMAVTGVARRVTLELVGSGEAHLEGLAADEVTVDKVGSGVARVAAARALRGTIVGSGDLFYAGRPATLAVDAIGSGSVRAVGDGASPPERTTDG